MDGQMNSYINAIQGEDNMEPLDLSVNSNKRHSEESGTFQERPLCLIKSCECQKGSLHPRLPPLYHEHQISCTAAAADGYLWRIEELTKQLPLTSETLIPCLGRDLTLTKDAHPLNRPQSCPITSSSTAKWSRLHGTPTNPGTDNLQESRKDLTVHKDVSDQKDVVSTHSTLEDKYPRKSAANDLSSRQQVKSSTENDQMDSESSELESQVVSKAPVTPQLRPPSPTSSVNRASENYLNLMHHLLQGCSPITDTFVTVRNHHDISSSNNSAGRDLQKRDSDRSENGVREDSETAMEQDEDSNHQTNDSVSVSKNTSPNGKDDGMDKELSEDMNNDTDFSEKKSPAADVKTDKVTKVNALDYLISKYLVQNVDVPYKPCNRKIRELLNSGETKICFMDLIELQIEKSFTVPG